MDINAAFYKLKGYLEAQIHTWENNVEILISIAPKTNGKEMNEYNFRWVEAVAFKKCLQIVYREMNRLEKS